MHAFPHRYQVSARATGNGDVTLSGLGLPDLASQPPAEFDGPGDRWSPESLLTAAVADCFILGFRAIAAASKTPFKQLDVSVEGVLDLVERKMQFTEMHIKANLLIPEGVNPERADKLLEKAEQACLVTNSLKLEPNLETSVAVG